MGATCCRGEERQQNMSFMLVFWCSGQTLWNDTLEGSTQDISHADILWKRFQSGCLTEIRNSRVHLSFHWLAILLVFEMSELSKYLQNVDKLLGLLSETSEARWWSQPTKAVRVGSCATECQQQRGPQSLRSILFCSLKPSN